MLILCLSINRVVDTTIAFIRTCYFSAVIISQFAFDCHMMVPHQKEGWHD
jgi:hypothetical protein